MRLITALFSLLFTILTVSSSAQAAECEALARSVITAASKVEAKLVSVSQMDVENAASASTERVERLVFATGGGEILVETLPSYYAKGVCELKSLKIDRE